MPIFGFHIDAAALGAAFFLFSKAIHDILIHVLTDLSLMGGFKRGIDIFGHNNGTVAEKMLGILCINMSGMEHGGIGVPQLVSCGGKAVVGLVFLQTSFKLPFSGKTFREKDKDFIVIILRKNFEDIVVEVNFPNAGLCLRELQNRILFIIGHGLADGGFSVFPVYMLLLQGCCFAALDMFLSGCAGTPIVAAILGFGANFLVWLIDLTADQIPIAWISEGMRFLSLYNRNEPFLMGQLSWANVVFELSFIGVFLAGAGFRLKTAGNR